MQITRIIENERLRLIMEGRLDGAWSEHAGGALTRAIEEGWHNIALDLDKVSFVSSAGIRVLVIHFKQLTKIAGLLSIVRPSSEVRSVLEMAGLGMMIAEEDAFPAEALLAEGAEAVPQFDHCGVACESYALEPAASLTIKGFAASDGESRVRFPEGTFGLGLGAIGADAADCHGRYGEAIALGGTILAQPADGRQTTDYLTSQGAFVPEMALRSGFVATGGFAELVRFDARAAGGHTPLSALVDLVLARAGQKAAGFVMIAETEALVGASLLAQPDVGGAVNFAFPEVRNQLRFTAEPAWPHTVSVVAGFVAATGDTPLAPLLRPVQAGRGPWVHIHAAAFPYRPLPKGLIELPVTLRALLEDGSALGVLHLLNDWRQPGGIGESRFRRGALWFAPVGQTSFRHD